MAMLRAGNNIEDLMTTLFIFRYLERMGDALLNVGEAIIFSIIGEKIKIHQFRSLHDNIKDSMLAQDMSGVDIKGIWGTRSGCTISKVDLNTHNGNGSSESIGIIYKEGFLDKMHAERDSLTRWNELYPGLVPKVINYQEGQDTASMMVEFISGHTLDEMLINSDTDMVDDVLGRLGGTMDNIWTDTMINEPPTLDYMDQIGSRIARIREVHPEFFKNVKRVGSLEVPSSEYLISECRKVEAGISAPFSVRIHGDCNVSNVIFNIEDRSLHFIDVYRSRNADYVQDVSVFLISIFRVPIFQPEVRNRLNWAIGSFLDSARGFARRNSDATFDIRMALALSRSLYTSTRFEFNYKFANEMFLRSHYLMEKVIRCGGRNPEKFQLPGQTLYY